MSNTLTDLISDIHVARDVVSRELTGMIPAIGIDSAFSVAAQDETIRWPVTPSASVAAITPSNTPPSLADQVIGNLTITLDQYYGGRFHYTGEEQKGLNNAGTYQSIFSQQITQQMRTIANQIEADLLELYYISSRALGTAGTTPFGSDLSAISAARKILDDNGAPMDRSIVIDTSAGLNMRNLTQLTNVNQAGSDSTLRNGELLNIHGFSIRESAQVQTHTVGTSTGQDCTAVEPIGETTIAYDGGNGGTILVGDTITLANDTSLDGTNSSNYVVNTAITAANGNIVINEPGMLQATSIAEEIGLGATNYVANLAFSRNAFKLGMRVPKLPDGGDMATGVYNVADPNTGLIFQVCEYPGYKARQFEVSALWGVAKGKSEHACIIMG